MKMMLLNILLQIVSQLTSKKLVNVIKNLVELANDQSMTGKQKREWVMERLGLLSRPYADHLVNLALEAAVAWLRSKAK